MTNIFVAFLFILSTISYSQNFNGDYRSYTTSFEDFSSTENNFIEASEFKIAVLIDENGKGGSLVIQDPRIPNKQLIYRILSFIGEREYKGVVCYLYKSEAVHLENPKETILSFYYPIDKKLSLMVYDNKSSQVFFDLKSKKITN